MNVKAYRTAASLTYLATAYLGVLYFELVFRLDPVAHPSVIAPYTSLGLFAAVFGWPLALWHQAPIRSVRLYAAPALVVVASSLGAGVAYMTAEFFLYEPQLSLWAILVAGMFVAVIAVMYSSPFLLLGCVVAVLFLRRLMLATRPP